MDTPPNEQDLALRHRIWAVLSLSLFAPTLIFAGTPLLFGPTGAAALVLGIASVLRSSPSERQTRVLAGFGITLAVIGLLSGVIATIQFNDFWIDE